MEIIAKVTRRSCLLSARLEKTNCILAFWIICTAFSTKKISLEACLAKNLSTSYFFNIIKMHIQQIHLAALARTFMQLLSPYTV